MRTKALTALSAIAATASLLLTAGSASACACGSAPAPAERGEIISTSTADLVTITDGTLSIYARSGTGWRAPVVVGGGWGAYDWVGSLGDIDGNGHSDLIARSATAGTLHLFRSQGRSFYASTTVLGSEGFDTFEDIAAPGDLDGDGLLDLKVLRSGVLSGYQVRWDGRTARLARDFGEGSRGWQNAEQLIGLGDLTGDGLADLAAIDAQGRLFGYRGTPVGLRSMGQIGNGWQALTAVAGPGDVTGDGLADLVARRSDGRLVVYPGRGHGFGPGRATGSGWNAVDVLV